MSGDDARGHLIDVLIEALTDHGAQELADALLRAFAEQKSGPSVPVPSKNLPPEIYVSDMGDGQGAWSTHVVAHGCPTEKYLRADLVEFERTQIRGIVQRPELCLVDAVQEMANEKDSPNESLMERQAELERFRNSVLAWMSKFPSDLGVRK